MDAHAIPSAHIGPNALVQTAQALEERLGVLPAAAFLGANGFAALVAERPTAPVTEASFAALVSAIVARFGLEGAKAAMGRAGELTAAYVVANRIPGTLKALMRVLPSAAATRIVIDAIAKNASTFGTSGSFRRLSSDRLAVENPALATDPAVTEAVCAYRRAAIAGILQAVADARVRIEQEACEAAGAPACTLRLVRSA